MSVQLNRLFTIAGIVLISFFITSCAGNHKANSVEDIEQSDNQITISSEELEQYRDSQQKWLSGLQDDLSPEDALEQVFPYLQYFFQYKKSGKFFQYFQGLYPATCMMFGLLFEDGRLTSLLLDKAVWDFDWYRYNYARVRGHLFQYWLPNGFQEGITMIRQHSQLGGEYDDVNTTCRQAVKDSGGAAKTSEAIITSLFFAPFLPYALVAMPFMPEEEIAREPEETAKRHDERLIEAAGKIKLGVTTDIELMQLLGTPDNKGDTSWTYEIPNLMKFGITDGIVSWIESWAKASLKMNNTAIHNNKARCEPSN